MQARREPATVKVRNTSAIPAARERVARPLGFSPRSFARRLETLGVSFSELADEVKYEAACSLLLKERRMSDIAAILGFAEHTKAR